MRWRFEVPGKLPSLNEYTSANRSNRFMGAKVKKQAEAEILASIGANPRTVVIVQDAWEPAPTAEDFAE